MTDLTDIKQRKAWYSQGDDAIRVVLSPYERDALCEALRIAVEGLDELTARFDGDEALVGSPLLNARTALAAVRELVDLGGDDW